MFYVYWLVGALCAVFFYFTYRMIRWHRRECKMISRERAAVDELNRRPTRGIKKEKAAPVMRSVKLAGRDLNQLCGVGVWVVAIVSGA